jgi:cob(I)alamin adenosyltransferase
MALYTKKGDGGSTTLFNTPNGKRLPKDSPVFDALGTLDELNTVIGLAKVAAKHEAVHCLGETLEELLHRVQDSLFSIQAEVAGAPHTTSGGVLTDIEARIHFIEKSLPPISSFFVPGGTEVSARLDHARAVSRRAERSVVALGEKAVSKETTAYLNRLSSLLYALTRYVNKEHGVTEQPPQYRD